MLKHVLRNAMIPILTNVGIALPGIFVGSFLLEVFFSIPGLGREIITAVNRSDFPVIKAVTVYLAIVTMVINLGVDVSCTRSSIRASRSNKEGHHERRPRRKAHSRRHASTSPRASGSSHGGACGRTRSPWCRSRSS